MKKKSHIVLTRDLLDQRQVRSVAQDRFDIEFLQVLSLLGFSEEDCDVVFIKLEEINTAR